MSTGIMTYGRFQPPHRGHEKLINKVKELSKYHGGDAGQFIFTSKTNDYDNPLELLDKLSLLWAIDAMATSAKSIFEALEIVSVLHKNLILVVGSDRVEHFKEIIEKYNGTTYNFDSIEVVSAGERDDVRWSGSYMRELARLGKRAEFISLCPIGYTPDNQHLAYSNTRAFYKDDV